MNNKLQMYADAFKKVIADHTYRAYKITPTKFWTTDPESTFDERLEVKL